MFYVSLILAPFSAHCGLLWTGQCIVNVPYNWADIFLFSRQSGATNVQSERECREICRKTRHCALFIVNGTSHDCKFFNYLAITSCFTTFNADLIAYSVDECNAPHPSKFFIMITLYYNCLYNTHLSGIKLFLIYHFIIVNKHSFQSP